MPVRARPGDADGDHGRHRPRRTRAACSSENAEALELLARVDVLVVDKTGTLTEGKPRVTAIDDRARIHRSGSASAGGGGRAGKRASAGGGDCLGGEARGISIPAVSRFVSTTGQGVSGLVDGRAVDIGTADFLRGLGIDTQALAAQADRIGARDRPRCSSRWTAASPASWRSPTRFGRRRPKRSGC